MTPTLTSLKLQFDSHPIRCPHHRWVSPSSTPLHHHSRTEAIRRLHWVLLESCEDSWPIRWESHAQNFCIWNRITGSDNSSFERSVILSGPGEPAQRAPNYRRCQNSSRWMPSPNLHVHGQPTPFRINMLWYELILISQLHYMTATDQRIEKSCNPYSLLYVLSLGYLEFWSSTLVVLYSVYGPWLPPCQRIVVNVLAMCLYINSF